MRPKTRRCGRMSAGETTERSRTAAARPARSSSSIRKLKLIIIQTLAEPRTIDATDFMPACATRSRHRRRDRPEVQAPGSVGLPAQERRDFELIVFHSLVHWRGLPAVNIEPLGAARRCRSRGRLAYSDTGSGCGRGGAAAAAAWPGRSARDGAGAAAGSRRHRGGRGRPAASRCNSDMRRFSGSASSRSPRWARISFCAGIGSSSIRGMRGARLAALGLRRDERLRHVLRRGLRHASARRTATASARSAGS